MILLIIYVHNVTNWWMKRHTSDLSYTHSYVFNPHSAFCYFIVSGSGSLYAKLKRTIN